mgnify:CR=1 FL=1
MQNFTSNATDIEDIAQVLLALPDEITGNKANITFTDAEVNNVTGGLALAEFQLARFGFSTQQSQKSVVFTNE